jgi:hypothetical protein
VISEAAVWSVLGHRGLTDYRHRREKETAAISALGNTGYSGCFHDTTKVLAAVEEMHKEIIHRRRAYIDNIVNQVLLTVGAMMAQDPFERPHAWKVHEYLTNAVHLATPPAMQPPATRIQPTSLLDRSSTFSGPTYPRPLSGASSIGQEEISRRSSRGLTPSTTQGPQQILPIAINSLVPQASTPVNRTAHPSTSIAKVLSYISKKKVHPDTTLPGEEWLKRLHGRDQVGKHESMAFDSPANCIRLDLPH